jgi:tetratricopeptide (TPR) repeat protein
VDRQPVSARAVFDRAVEIEPAERRRAYLEDACAGSPGLKEKVEGLLRAYEAAGSFTRAVDLEPRHPAAWVQRGEALAELGQWHKAGADFSRAVALKAEGVTFHYWLALARLGARDLDGYRRACGACLHRFGRAEKPEVAHWVAWAAVLAPDAVKDPGRVVKRAEVALRSDPRNGWYATTLGAALYRAGRLDDSVRRLEEASAAWEKAPTKPTGYSPAYAWFFLATAHRRLGHGGAARRWLDRATRHMGQETRTNVPAWNRRLTLQLLRREAEALVKPGGAK